MPPLQQALSVKQAMQTRAAKRLCARDVVTKMLPLSQTSQGSGACAAAHGKKPVSSPVAGLEAPTEV
jgi:hypothetical protein